MATQKPDSVSKPMRDRLLTNRYGKLTVSQWTDIVTQPLVALAVLFIPLGFVLLPRLLLLTRFGSGIGILFILGVLALSLIPRAIRYARIPVQFAEMTADSAPPLWMFWRAPLFIDDSGQRVQFSSKLAPAFTMTHKRRYLVYYLKDNERYVLLSAAPLDHADMKRWQPNRVFEDRLKRRKSKADSAD